MIPEAMCSDVGVGVCVCVYPHIYVCRISVCVLGEALVINGGTLQTRQN